jgi:hypothetical protein
MGIAPFTLYPGRTIPQEEICEQNRVFRGVDCQQGARPFSSKKVLGRLFHHSLSGSVNPCHREYPVFELLAEEIL